MLNASGKFSDSNSSSTTALQFVAKLHELLMQTSITEILICIIRMHLVHHYVPLGALKASVQATHISYLWSLDFMSIITSRVLRGWRKVLFAVMIPILIVLTALVGPSSAILMIPRSRVPSYATYNSAMSSSSILIEVFSSHVGGANSTLFDEMRFQNTYSLSKSADLEMTTLEAYTNNNSLHIQKLIPRVMRYKRFKDVVPADYDSSMPFIVSATAAMPTQWSARFLYENTRNLGQSSETTATIDVFRPVVMASCALVLSKNLRLDSPLKYIKDDKVSFGTASTVRETLSLLLPRNGSVNDLDLSNLSPIWSMSPEKGSSSLVGAFFRYLERCPLKQQSLLGLLQKGDKAPIFECFAVWTCTISAFWEPSKDEIVFKDGTTTVRTPALTAGGSEVSEDAQPITLDLTGTTWFGEPSIFKLLQSADDVTNLVGVLVTVLSELPQGTRSFRNVTETSENIFKVLGFSIIPLKMTSYGYGYNLAPMSVRLSLAVIGAYCVITILYMSYILMTGLTSTAWDSAAELVLLALQSKRPGHLGHTSVGISSMKTLQEGIGIRANDENELELVLAKNEGECEGELRMITHNQVY
ncbi:hypothetical protein IQ07DRAFT_642966 [Pyrenochaeta sp. DS3sAY3a]|nr:hypothetical protein IQ07DRAFT_642966 [Pyrenochaeta sp. DS3sAY3a]